MNKSFDIIFLGLARNVRTTIFKFFLSLEKIGKNLNVLAIIGENSSKDGTREILTNYKNINFEFILLKTDELKTVKNRITRLTLGRQMLKQFIEKNKIKSKYISVVDLDEVISEGISLKNYSKMLEILENNKSDLFGISSKSLPYYYDLLPLIIKDYFEFDIYKIQTKFSLIDLYSIRKKFIYDFQKKITKMRDVLTISSHNGLTTYFYDDYLLGNYENKEKNKIVSEHINFNEKIHIMTKKFVLMSNDFNLVTPQEHMPLTLKQFFIKSFTKIFK